MGSGGMTRQSVQGKYYSAKVELCNRKWPVPHDVNDRVISVNKTVAELTSEFRNLLVEPV